MYNLMFFYLALFITLFHINFWLILDNSRESSPYPVLLNIYRNPQNIKYPAPVKYNHKQC